LIDVRFGLIAHPVVLLVALLVASKTGWGRLGGWASVQESEWFVGALGLFICLIAFAYVLIISTARAYRTLRDWVVGVPIEPTRARHIPQESLEFAAAVIAGITIMLLLWLYVPAMLFVFFPSLLLLSVVQTLAGATLRQSGFYLWKQSLSLGLSRWRGMYSLTILTFLALGWLHNVILVAADYLRRSETEGLSLSTPGVLERYSHLISSPFATVEPVGPLASGPYRSVIEAAQSQLAFVDIIAIGWAICLALFLFTLFHFLSFGLAWREQMSAITSEDAAASLGDLPAGVKPERAPRLSGRLRMAAAVEWALTLIEVWGGVFVACNIVFFLVSDSGWPWREISYPFAWFVTVSGQWVPAGETIASCILAFWASLLMIGPVLFLGYRVGRAVKLACRLRRHRTTSSELSDVVGHLRPGLNSTLVLYSPEATSPSSYKFLTWTVIEWPWRDLPPAHQAAEAWKMAMFLMEHELHHAEHHLNRIRVQQWLSSASLLSPGILTLGEDTLRLEQEADQAGLRRVGDNDLAVAALHMLKTEAELRIALDSSGRRSGLKQMFDMIMTDHILGYAHPTLPDRVAALKGPA